MNIGKHLETLDIELQSEMPIEGQTQPPQKQRSSALVDRALTVSD